MTKELKHVGVRGMHWGIHRGPVSADHTKARELKKKHVSELSNKDIQAITTRLQLEKSLKSLDAGKTNRGKEMVGKLLTKFGPMILSAIMAKYAKNKYDQWRADPLNTLPILEGVVS